MTSSAESITTCDINMSGKSPGQTPLTHAIPMDSQLSPATAADLTPDLENYTIGTYSNSFGNSYAGRINVISSGVNNFNVGQSAA